MVDWLIGDLLIVLLVGSLVVWLVGNGCWLIVDWLAIGRLVMIGWLIGWLVVLLVGNGWWIGWLVFLLVGW